LAASKAKSGAHFWLFLLSSARKARKKDIES